LCDRAKALGIATKQRRSAAGASTGGGPFSRGHLYCLLSNPLYVGRVAHRDLTYPGQHQPIVDEDLWQAAQAMLADNRNGIGRDSCGSEPSLLVGLIFDETGDRLSPSHAVKGGRRYRYYISHRLMQASRRDSDGWRLPAHELERTVVAAVADYLRNHGKLVEDLRLDNHRPDRLQRLLDAADALAADIRAMPPAALRSRLTSIVRRIDLLPAELRMHLERDALWELLTAEKAPKGIQPPIAVIVPITRRRRGVESKLVVGGKPAKADEAPDLKLVGLIIKAHKAVGMLVAGDAVSVDAASAALGMDASDVTRIIPLAFLAPDITAAILDGRCPTSLTANRLRSIGPLPADWAEQRRILEFAGSVSSSV
ncbi:MAG: recombinase family protein, partial [Bauldia sp.]|nr:recombinase family protein [Bauldia sp.]